jgi:hypothetical protein
MSPLRMTIAAAAVATVAIIVLPATAAVAEEQPLEVVATTFLPNSDYVDMAMSPFSGQLFVSGGRDSTTITVLKLDGAILGSVADQAGARPDDRPVHLHRSHRQPVAPRYPGDCGDMP